MPYIIVVLTSVLLAFTAVEVARRRRVRQHPQPSWSMYWGEFWTAYNWTVIVLLSLSLAFAVGACYANGNCPRGM